MPPKRKVVSRRKSTRLRKKDFKIELESGIAREVGAVVYIGLSVIFYFWGSLYLSLIASDLMRPDI